MLSFLRVSNRPESCLRFRCSSRYLRIPPLHLEFRFPRRYSSRLVSNAISWLSHEISHQTCPTPCEPFTPNKSEQRSPPTYYRGCWHVVSRGFLSGYRLRQDGISTRLFFLAYRDWETDRKSTRLNSSHSAKSRMPSSA